MKHKISILLLLSLAGSSECAQTYGAAASSRGHNQNRRSSSQENQNPTLVGTHATTTSGSNPNYREIPSGTGPILKLTTESHDALPITPREEMCWGIDDLSNATIKDKNKKFVAIANFTNKLNSRTIPNKISPTGLTLKLKDYWAQSSYFTPTQEEILQRARKIAKQEQKYTTKKFSDIPTTDQELYKERATAIYRESRENQLALLVELLTPSLKKISEYPIPTTVESSDLLMPLDKCHAALYNLRLTEQQNAPQEELIRLAQIVKDAGFKSAREQAKIQANTSSQATSDIQKLLDQKRMAILAERDRLAKAKYILQSEYEGLQTLYEQERALAVYLEVQSARHDQSAVENLYLPSSVEQWVPLLGSLYTKETATKTYENHQKEQETKIKEVIDHLKATKKEDPKEKSFDEKLKRATQFSKVFWAQRLKEVTQKRILPSDIKDDGATEECTQEQFSTIADQQAKMPEKERILKILEAKLKAPYRNPYEIRRDALGNAVKKYGDAIKLSAEDKEMLTDFQRVEAAAREEAAKLELEKASKTTKADSTTATDQ